MRLKTLSASVLLVASGLACADKAPARITCDMPKAITNTSFFTLPASVVNKTGQAIEGASVAWSGGPADVLEVSADGRLRCAKTGDATLTLSSGAVSQRLDVKCRVPVEIAAPAELQVVMGALPASLHAKALGDGGTALEDVEVQVTSSDPSIATVDGDRVKGVAVGKTRVQATAGGITTVTQVDVVERIVAETVTLKDGGSKAFTLQPGNYLVTVDLKTDERVKQGVTIGWAGTACESQPEKTSQRVTCRVAETATLTVTNPKLMGLGAPVSGTVSVYRIPG